MVIPGVLAEENCCGEAVCTTEDLRLGIEGRAIRLQAFAMASALHLTTRRPCLASLPFKSVAGPSRQIWLHGGVYSF